LAVAFVHPATFYVRYLLLVLEDPSREVVNKQLELYGIAELQPSQFLDILSCVADAPAGLKLHDRRDRTTSGWLKAMRIYRLVHQDESVREVFEKILPNRRLREVIEQLVLGNVVPMEASFRLRDLGYRVSDVAIADFAHFFWNNNIMGVADWADYLKRDSSKGRTGTLNDTYVAALHGGPELAMYRAGIEVSIDSKKLLEEVRAELAFTFREVRGLPLSGKKVEMLGTLARNIVKIDERMAASDSALQDVLRRFEKFKVISDDHDVPSLIELAPSGTVSDKSRTEILKTRER
jgi:hypothetical protein